jgi:hypothetical protein
MASSEAVPGTLARTLRVVGGVVLLTLALAPDVWARQSVPDSTYGSGGTKTTSVTKDADGTTHKTDTYRDKSGTVRESFTETTDAGGRSTSVDQEFDDTGAKRYEEELHYDPTGRLVYDREEEYNIYGIPYWGDIFEIGPNGEKTYKAYNPESQQYEPYTPKRWLWFLPAQKASISDGLYLAGAAVLEDSASAFFTYGVEASYTRALWNGAGTHAPVGLMADVQWTRGTSDEQTYTKLQVLGGLALCASVRRDVYVGVHILGGVSHVSASSFALAAGVDVGKRLNEAMDVQGRVDYNPTFQSGTVSNNIRFSGGLRWRF